MNESRDKGDANSSDLYLTAFDNVPKALLISPLSISNSFVTFFESHRKTTCSRSPLPQICPLETETITEQDILLLLMQIATSTATCLLCIY